MSTYTWDLHDIGCSTFQSIQAQAIRAEQANVLGANVKALEESARNAPPAEQAQLLAAATKLRNDMVGLGVDMGQLPATPTLSAAPAAPAATPGIVGRFTALSPGKKLALGLGALGVGWAGCRWMRGRAGG